MRRGTARAVAHIGVEILLDEILSREEQSRRAYLAALSIPLDGALRFDAPADGERFEALRRTLIDRAAAARNASAGEQALRIRRTLQHRPRLSTDDAGQSAIERWITRARPEIEAVAPRLLAEVRERLARAPSAE